MRVCSPDDGCEPVQRWKPQLVLLQKGVKAAKLPYVSKLDVRNVVRYGPQCSCDGLYLVRRYVEELRIVVDKTLRLATDKQCGQSWVAPV
jgi:hypothetical protein